MPCAFARITFLRGLGFEVSGSRDEGLEFGGLEFVNGVKGSEARDAARQFRGCN